MNSNNFLKVAVLRQLFINILLLSILISCDKIKSKNELIFKDCKVLYKNNKLFTGKFKLFKGDKYILTQVKNGTILYEKKYLDGVLIMEKSFEGCKKGFQKIYDNNGELKMKGFFSLNKKVGKWIIYSEDSLYNINYQ